jgi:L-seryl-tRNA(Ser) seleniumtransferase
MNDLLQEGAARDFDVYGREALHRAIDAALVGIRATLASASPRAIDELFWEEVGSRLAVLPVMRVRKAINATGTVLHTNLGRAPWPREAYEAVEDAIGAAVLEIDPESGQRGKREAPVSALLAELTGAEAGLAVNNNAAALLLAVSALARGRKVVVSRSELVAIGGSYRMPEVIDAAGAEMIEVGTTNKVELDDFRVALRDPGVAAVLRIHRSNFEIEGFTGEPETSDLAALCKEHGVPLVYDLGSGVLHGAEMPCVADEPSVLAALLDGCEVVTFSGDKILGGPQAGLIVGVAPLVERLRRDMLTRCLRLDKTMLAALEATLRVHLLGPDAAFARIPALRMLSLTRKELQLRAESFQQKLLAERTALASDGAQVPGAADDCALLAEVVLTDGRVGSGASPTADLPGAGLAIQLAGSSADELARRLRLSETAVYARIQDDRVILDLRTVQEHEESELFSALLAL